MSRRAKVNVLGRCVCVIGLSLLGLSAWAQTPVNVAAAANGGVATASSFYSADYSPSITIDGDRKGLMNPGNGGMWNDATGNSFPDWLQVSFNGLQSVAEIDVFSVQDNYTAPAQPTPTMTFSLWGLRDFQVQYWTGSAWADVPGGNVTGNTLVWRRFTFAPISTDRIRVLVNNAGQSDYSRATELEAWAAPEHFIAGTVTAAGAPLAGVTVSAGNGTSCNPSNASGQYSCTVPPNWSGNVTPSLLGYFFTPASRSFSGLQANQTAQDFVGAPAVPISGTVTANGAPFAGIALAANNGATCTSSDASGNYSCAAPPGWSGSVTPPSLIGYTFTPTSRSFSNVQAAQTAQDFAAATATVTISGTVTTNGAPQAGIALAANNGATCVSSDSGGNYSCVVPLHWSGKVVPLGGYTFTPMARTYSNAQANQSAQDFAGVPSAVNAYYINTDHLNTPRLITDATQQARWRWDQQEPFGVNVPDENPAGQGAFEFPQRLSLYYSDGETANWYAQKRDAYSSGIGRFIQSDPIGLGGGINTYAYVASGPLGATDMLGLQAFPIFPPRLPPTSGSAGSQGGKSSSPWGDGAFSDGNKGSAANDSKYIECPKCQFYRSEQIVAHKGSNGIDVWNWRCWYYCPDSKKYRYIDVNLLSLWVACRQERDEAQGWSGSGHPDMPAQGGPDLRGR